MNKKRNLTCKGCGVERYVFGKKEYCRSCSAKKRWGYLDSDIYNKSSWKSACKKCGDVRKYTHFKSYKQRRDLCASCSQIKNDDHYNRAFSKYRGKVWSETNRQELHLLDNFSKRGKSGKDGAYQLDHIKSIKYGFDNNISEKVIGNINNLQMLPWKENRLKG